MSADLPELEAVSGDAQDTPTYFGTEEDKYPELVPVLDNGMPHEDWVRGTCPECGLPLISNMFYVPPKGYAVVWECWGLMQEEPTCTYRRVL